MGIAQSVEKRAATTEKTAFQSGKPFQRTQLESQSRFRSNCFVSQPFFFCHLCVEDEGSSDPQHYRYLHSIPEKQHHLSCCENNVVNFAFFATETNLPYLHDSKAHTSSLKVAFEFVRALQLGATLKSASKCQAVSL